MKFLIAVTLIVLSTANFGARAETPEEQQACQQDAFTFCGQAIPDRTRVAICLRQNFPKISAACRTVMNRYPVPNATAASAPLDIGPRSTR